MEIICFEIIISLDSCFKFCIRSDPSLPNFVRGVIDFLGDKIIQLWLLIDFKYFKAYKFGWSHLKELSKLFQNLMNFNSFGSKMAVQ